MSYQVTIRYESGSSVERTLRGTEWVIGRAPECEILLNDPMVSRRHARLVRTETELLIADLGSTNGTFVDGRHIRGVTSVTDGTIRIGGCRISFAQGSSDGAADDSQLAEIAAAVASFQQLPDVCAETELPDRATRASGRTAMAEAGTSGESTIA